MYKLCLQERPDPENINREKPTCEDHKDVDSPRWFRILTARSNSSNVNALQENAPHPAEQRHIVQIHSLLPPLRLNVPKSPLVKPLLSVIVLYTQFFDAAYESTFAPIHHAPLY